MHNYCKARVIISFLSAFVISNVENVSEVDSSSTPPSSPPSRPPSPQQGQIALAAGVYNDNLWQNTWFTSIVDEQDRVLMVVRSLMVPRAGVDVRKKIRLIPTMMGCHYGVRFNWFLSLAVTVIGECNVLSQQLHDHTSDCWDQLRNVLQTGSVTALKVMTSLASVQTIANVNVGSGALYPIMSAINNYLRQCSTVDNFAGTQYGLTYGEQLNSHTIALFRYLFANCHPDFQPVLLEQIMSERCVRAPNSLDYEYYLEKMRFHVQFVSNHLTSLGFN